MKVKFICTNGATLPKPSTELAGAVDLTARTIIGWKTANNVPVSKEDLDEINWKFGNKQPIRLLKGQRIIIGTGLIVADVPYNFQGDVKTRSGLAYNEGVFVINGDGLVDADYRKEIGVILTNISNEAFEIRQGDRVAQFEVRKKEEVFFEETNEIVEAESDRVGGFGSTGK